MNWLQVFIQEVTLEAPAEEEQCKWDGEEAIGAILSSTYPSVAIWETGRKHLSMVPPEGRGELGIYLRLPVVNAGWLS